MIDKDAIINALWANSNHGTRRDDVVAIWDAAYQQGLEDAARTAAIHSQYPAENDFDRGYGKGAKDASDRIRKLGENNV